MQIIVKSLKNFELFEDNKDYVEKKFRKFEKMVSEPAVLEITFEHTHATRANIDKKIHLNFTMAGMKKAEHIEELSEHFKESIDLLQKRFEIFLARFKNKKFDRAKKLRRD